MVFASNFASTTQPVHTRQQCSYMARGPAKPPCRLFNIYADMYKYQVLSINERTKAPILGFASDKQIWKIRKYDPVMDEPLQCKPSQHKRGQKYADPQRGTTRVPAALQTFKWLRTLQVRQTGGQSQLLSLDQSWAKALTPTRVQNVCACARSLFSNWRLRMQTSQQECLFLS